MAVGDIVPVPGTRFEDTLESASPDLLRKMIRGFAQRMMDAEVEAVCGAGYGEVSTGRVNSRNGYRPAAAQQALQQRGAFPRGTAAVTARWPPVRPQPCGVGLAFLPGDEPG